MARPFEFNRDDAVQKASLLFWEKGYCNTSSQDIVEHLEINRSSIYNSFSDKQSLFIEAMKNYVNTESQSLTAFLMSMPPNPESIAIILQSIVDANFKGNVPKGCLIVNSAIEFADSNTQIQEIIENNVSEVINQFTKFINAGQKLKTINNNVKDYELATALFNQITALRVTGKVIQNKNFFKTSISAFIKMFNN